MKHVTAEAERDAWQRRFANHMDDVATAEAKVAQLREQLWTAVLFVENNNPDGYLLAWVRKARAVLDATAGVENVRDERAGSR